MAEVRLKVVLDGAEQTINTVSQLEDALQRTKNELAGLEIGSTGFKTLQNQARQLDSELKNIQKSTEGVDTAKLAGSFAKLGESVVGAFAVSTSALKLFGKDSEDITKAQEQAQQTLNIVLGARAITEGVVEGAAAARLVVDKVSIITTSALSAAFGRQTVALAAEAAAAGTATTAQIALNTAMKASPIGLLIAGIAALIIYWDDLTEAIGLTNTEQDNFNKALIKSEEEGFQSLVKGLTDVKVKYIELEDAIASGNFQADSVRQLVKLYPELSALTGKEADIQDKISEALLNRKGLENAEVKRKVAQEELTAILVEQESIQQKQRRGELQYNAEAEKFMQGQIAMRRDALRLASQDVNYYKTLIDESTKAAEAEKARQKAAQDAYNKRIEQIKQERSEIQKLLQSVRQDAKKANEDRLLDDREYDAQRIKNRFEQEKVQLQIATDRQNAELNNQRKAALDQINATILSETEKNKARVEINKQFNDQILANNTELQSRIAEVDQQAAEQRLKVETALYTELNYGDSQFVDTREARRLRQDQFENELNQRKLTDGAFLNRMTLKQQEEYYDQLKKLQQEQLTLESQQRKDANNATYQQELQLARDRKDIGDITAEQLKVIEENLAETKRIENEKVDKDIAQKRIAINKQTEEQILQTRIQSLQAYLGVATQGLQALAAVSSTIEQTQLARVTERNNAELDANQQKNQSILDQELARIDAETTTEAEKVAKRDAAIKKSQDQKAKDDKKTEEKIEKQRNEIRKKAFARTKALNIATALVNGAQAVLQAIAQFGPPPSPLGIAGIAAAGVLTAAQVAAISAQQYQEEGGGPSRELSVPETAGVGEVAGAAGPPSGGFTLFNPDLVNVTQTGGRGAAGGGGTMGPLRVIVVESDITNAQNSVRTTVDQASFG